MWNFTSEVRFRCGLQYANPPRKCAATARVTYTLPLPKEKDSPSKNTVVLFKTLSLY